MKVEVSDPQWVRDPRDWCRDRWVLVLDGEVVSDGSELRVLLPRNLDWEIRFDGDNADAIRHKMPRETPLEEVQAMAIALWRLK